MKEIRKRKEKRFIDMSTLKEYITITVGIFLVAIAVYFFMQPADYIVGSMVGLAMIINKFIPVEVSVLTFILSSICLIVGFFFLGKEFGIKTVYTSLMLPVFLRLFEVIYPNNPSLTNDIILDALCYVIVISVGQAFLFHVNASSGGTDIIAKILNKYLHIDLGNAIAVTGIVIVLTSIFVYDTKSLIVGILATYFHGIVLEEYIGGFSRKKRISILSEKYEEIQNYIINELHRGVTLYAAQGGYDHTFRREIITVLAKDEYAYLMKYVREVDPKAFVTVSTVSEVVGRWGAGRKNRVE